MKSTELEKEKENVEELEKRILQITKPYVEKLLEILSEDCENCEDEEIVEFELTQDQKIGEVLSEIEKELEKMGFDVNAETTYTDNYRVELLVKIFTETKMYEVSIIGIKLENEYDINISDINEWNLSGEDTPFSNRIDQLWNYPIRDLWAQQILKTIDEIIEIERKGQLREKLPEIYQYVKVNSWIYEFNYLRALIEKVASEFGIPLEK
jgi:hypothetical protein